MRLFRTVALLCVTASLAATASAQDTRPAPRFRTERPVVSGTGPQRLPVDVPLLAGAQPRTGNDLRLYNAAGNEIPHLLIFPPSATRVWVTGGLATIPSTKTTSGFEVDLAALNTIDRIRLTGIPAPFMKLANLEGSGDRSHWTVLIDQTTVFDLPDTRLQQLELGFPAGSYRYVRVTWNDANSAKAPLPTRVDARLLTTDTAAAPALTTPLAIERRPSEPGRSRYRLHLPGADLPIMALDVIVQADYVLRRATVTEARFISAEVAPFVIASTMLRREGRIDGVPTPLRILVGAPAEPDIELVIEDGDNPPLELMGVNAVFEALPWIYFEGDGTPLVARYGDPKLPPPQYDLEAARASIHIETVPDATWGSPRALNPDAAGQTTITTAMPTGGAPMDTAQFRYVRLIPSGDAGLIAVPLDAAALAHSTGPGARFADVRVMNSSAQQVPYVLERRDEPLMLAVTLDQRDAPAGITPQTSGLTSYYRVRLPFSKLPSPRLVLTTTSRVFDRQVTVALERPADERHRSTWVEAIASGRWMHADRDTPAPALTLDLPGVDATDYLITVAEGDNSRLVFASAQLLLPAYRIRLFRENGVALRMAYGRTDIAPPTYDLALLAPQVLGVTAREVNVAAEQAGPASQTQTAGAAALLSPKVFWSVLVIAVAVLLTLLARLLKRPAV